MKNLLWLVHGGLGERDRPGAPTFWKTVEGFVADGWKVWIVDIGSKEDTPVGERDYGDGLYIVRFMPPFLKELRIRKIGTIFHFLQQLWITGKLKREAEKLIAAQNLTRENTVVYGMECGAVQASKAIAAKYDMPFVTRFYGIWDMYSVPYNLINRLRRYPRFEAFGTKADYVIMTNDGTNGDKMLQKVNNPSPYVFWRNGVDLAPENESKTDAFPVLPDNARILMTLSRLHPGKRIDRAIDALPAVLEKHPEARLVICGYGDEREALERRAVEKGVENEVLFAGRIDHKYIYTYLKCADMFLSFYDASNLGNPLFEAMRCGLPIVTLDTGNTSSVIENDRNGILLPPDQPEKIAEAIIRLLDDPAEAKRLGDAAGAFARENFWTWDERVAAEIKLINDLLKEKNNNGE